jgi:hypothetical protein
VPRGCQVEVLAIDRLDQADSLHGFHLTKEIESWAKQSPQVTSTMICLDDAQGCTTICGMLSGEAGVHVQKLAGAPLKSLEPESWFPAGRPAERVRELVEAANVLLLCRCRRGVAQGFTQMYT